MARRKQDEPKQGRRGRGEGSITQRADGTWRGYVTTGYGPKGAIRKYYYGKAFAEVRDKVSGAQQDVRRGLPLPGERQTVASFLEDWLTTVAAQRVRPNTLASYREIVTLHVVPHIGTLKLAKLAPQDVRAMLKRLEDAGVSPHRRRYARTVLRIALNHAIRDGLVIRNAAALTDAPKVERVEVQPLSPEQVRKFLGAAKGERLEGLYVTAVASGLRRSELLGLTWQHVDLERGMLRVVAGVQRVGKEILVLPPKTEKSKRTVTLPQIAVASLRAHRTRQLEERLLAGSRWQETGLVFTSTTGTALDGANVSHRFHALLERAGLPTQRFHDLRHACASFLLAQGIPAREVMEVLGHSQIGTTMNLYTHIMPAMHQEAADRMDELLSGT